MEHRSNALIRLAPDGVFCELRAAFLVLGGLTAADRRLPATAVTALAAVLGLLHGWLNGAGIAEAGREALGLVGIVSAVFVVVALVAAFVIWLRPPWTRIAVRVAGSWIAASFDASASPLMVSVSRSQVSWCPVR